MTESVLTLQSTSSADRVCWRISGGCWKAGNLTASQTGPRTSKELDLFLSYDLLVLTLNWMWLPRDSMVASAVTPELWLGCDLCIKIGLDILSFITFNQRLNAALRGQGCIDSGKLLLSCFENFPRIRLWGEETNPKLPESFSPTDLKPHIQLLSSVIFHMGKKKKKVIPVNLLSYLKETQWEPHMFITIFFTANYGALTTS